jgi:hypothetical protein
MNHAAMAIRGLDACRKSGRGSTYVLVAIALGGLLLVLFFGLAVIFIGIPLADKRSHEAGVRACQDELKRQLADVRSGRTTSLFFYCSVGTDGLLEQMVNVPEIEGVDLHLTDVTDKGMKSLLALKSLKSLTIYGGRVGDQGFAYIKAMPSIESLSLINTRVTDRSLSSLRELPNLKSLTLFHENRLGSTFSDAGLQHLKALKKLKRLNVSDGWASDAAVKSLQAAMPNCTISTKEDDIDN